ncbi:MAG TPA: hypothetical protein VG297_01910 [Bryobacteraceae bacterium]|nr:hypothetical protein [Bryobacteraceae bacterium]
MLTLRPATWADGDAILRLNERNGVDLLSASERQERWSTYPFEDRFGDIPIGWVLETESGQIVGAVDNVHLLYEIDGRPIRAAAAANWAVDTEYRADSLRLMTTFFRQKEVDLCLGVSASPVASKIFTAMKIARLPIPDYGSPCFWPMRRRAFARAALARRKMPAAGLLAVPAGVALLAKDIWSGSGRGRTRFKLRRMENFDPRFDGLLTKIRTGPGRLRAVRDCRVLDWRFGKQLRARRATIVACENGGTLAGYAVLLRREGEGAELNLYDVADLQAYGDNPEIVRDLLLGAIRLAREDGVDAVKYMTGTPDRRAVVMALRPYTYQLPFWQQYYRAPEPDLASALEKPDAWDFSLFDTF